MHINGIAHRALHPGSIFFVRKGNFTKLKIGNFESMVMLTEEEQLKDMYKTPRFNDEKDAKERQSIFMFHGISYYKVQESARILDDNLVNEIEEKIKRYMAPELLNQEIYDQKVDIWSAGVIFYQLLTGKLPFSEDKFDPDFGLLDKYPDCIKDLLPKMLEVDPENRSYIIELLETIDKIDKYINMGNSNIDNGNITININYKISNYSNIEIEDSKNEPSI
jgi:serine/threonine protein kinase